MKVKTSTFGLFLSLFIFIGIIFILQGCSANNITDNNAESISEIDNILVYEYIDPDTHVHYLVYDGYNECSISVRYNSDGTIMVD